MGREGPGGRRLALTFDPLVDEPRQLLPVESMPEQAAADKALPAHKKPDSERRSRRYRRRRRLFD